MARRGFRLPNDVARAASELFTVSVGRSATNVPSQEVTEFDTLSLKLNFSTGDMLSFSTAGWTPEALQTDELASDLYLEGPIEQRFRVINVDQEWNEDGGDVVAITATSYKRLLTARLIQAGGLIFNQVDQGDIVWGLIAHTQATLGGDWRVTKGPVTTGVLRDRTYIEGDNIGDLADKISEVINGLWWDIDYDLVLQAKMPDDFPVLATPIQLGANARKVKRTSSAAAFANAVYVDGNQDKTTPVWRQAPDLATDPRGRWETAIGYPTVEVQATLDEHADGALRDVQSPLSAWTIDLEPSRWLLDSLYLPGDHVVLVIPRSSVAPIGTPRERVVVQVQEATVAITADGALTVGLAVIETKVPVP